MLAPPIAHLEAINRATLNACLEQWGHRMGPYLRPSYKNDWMHALFHNGDPVAVAAASQLIAPRVAGFSRAEAFELARLCAARPHLNRVMLRLWREFVGVSIAQQEGYRAVVSYQDKKQHTGNTYRFDGWARLAESRSGTDARALAGTRSGRSKIIWAWEFEKKKGQGTDPLPLVAGSSSPPG
ncbi:MAG: hypothetical protein OXC11_00705 [Rhodospirillales bacterium]|nr:hypothetical protein [Rhodospirillales bacterium]